MQQQASLARPGRARAALVPTRVLLATQCHCHAVVVFSEARFGKLQLQFSQHIQRSQDLLGLRADALRHLEQDAVNFRQFFFQQPHQFVVLLDRLQRLDEHGLPARTRAVHHALHAPFLLDFHRDDKAFAADGHEFVLHRAALGQPPQIAAQRFLNGAALFFDLAANARQLGRSFIFQRSIGLDLVAEEAQKFGEVDDLVGECAHSRSSRTSYSPGDAARSPAIPPRDRPPGSRRGSRWSPERLRRCAISRQADRFRSARKNRSGRPHAGIRGSHWPVPAGSQSSRGRWRG